jgi:nucleotide-binding universal stress UspA family protein
MIRTILVAMDDTAAALASARFAVELAHGCGATVHAIAAVPPDEQGEQDEPAPAKRVDLVAPGGRTGADHARAASAVLNYVVRLCRGAGVPIETAIVHGEPAACILAQARHVDADVVVLGRSGLAGLGQPYIGSQTRQVLEFAERPVVVVPPSRRPEPVRS